MGQGSHIHIDINNSGRDRSQPASVTDEEDELHAPGFAGSLYPGSPELSELHHSNSGSSSHHGDYARDPSFLHHPVYYPSELPPAVPYAPQPTSRPEPHRAHHSRSNLTRRGPQRQQSTQGPSKRNPKPPSPTDSGESTSEDDSTEEYLQERDHDPYGMSRPRQYYQPGGYAQSGSSASQYYPPVPHPSNMNQLTQYGGHPQSQHGLPPAGAQYAPHINQPHHGFPPGSGPPAAAYPPPLSHHPPSHHPPGPISVNPPSHVGPYGNSPYGAPAIHQHYGPPTSQPSYFPPGYHPSPYPYSSPYPQPHLYNPHQAPHLPEFMQMWRASPRPPAAQSASSSSSEKPPVVDQEEIIKRFEALLLAKDEERKAAEAERQKQILQAEDRVAAFERAQKERAAEEARIRTDALKQAQEQADAAAKARAERDAEEARIRKEAAEAVREGIKAAELAAAEQSAREAKIRQEAAKAALEAAEAEAKARAAQEAKEAKIAADAAEAAKTEAEKKAAADAAAVQEAAKKASEEAETKMKEAAAAAEKATKEAEEAKAAAAAAAPPDKKAPVRFKDAIGRNYNFPWERCHKWRDMESLIIQAFQHVSELAEHVNHGRYDLIGPDKEIIMPQYWDVTIQPDMSVTMMLWPLPEKPPEPDPLLDGMLPPPIPDGVIDLDELLNPRKKNNRKSRGGVGMAFGNWMLGGAPRPRKTLKDNKKPEGAHHGAVATDACIVM